MGQNVGYLTAGNGKSSDETLTPAYAVRPIVKYLIQRGYHKIWCPFSLEHSQYVKVLQKRGFDVVYNKNGEDFFTTKIPDGCDCIVENAPFSVKDLVLNRLYASGLPFAVLFPQNTLQGKERTNLFMNYGLQYLGFDSRITFYTKSKTNSQGGYHWTPDDLRYMGTSVSFATGYFCRYVLNHELTFETLEREQVPYCRDEEIDSVIASLVENEARW